MNQPSVFVPPELLQTLLQQTDGTPLQREKITAHVRELLFATPIRTAEEEAAPFVAAAVTEASTTDDQDSTRSRLVPVQPPKFIGFGDLQSPDEFLDHLENFCLVQGVKLEDQLSRVVPAAVQGSAKLWFRFTENFVDWSMFATAFRKKFAPVDEKKRLKEELRLRTQHPEENLKQFIYVIASYYDRIGDDVTEAERSSGCWSKCTLSSKTAAQPTNQVARDLAFYSKSATTRAPAQSPAVAAAPVPPPVASQAWPLHPASLQPSYYRDQLSAGPLKDRYVLHPTVGNKQKGKHTVFCLGNEIFSAGWSIVEQRVQT
ncbi:hypothetical protein HPB47_010934 [Ixodes persulcatus]|uniref:Uncharacterized protein n=1 Tax=Ixodes persulcatus TaxID=34615 RepID=A0AC60NXQ3_IXOPE|nr:hypothetical protein HPB47_010934 [Ixodes persulcatus]